jgi:hypothetical protein
MSAAAELFRFIGERFANNNSNLTEDPMKRFALKFASDRLRSLVLGAALAVAGLGLAGTTAQASDYCPSYRYEWVVCYEFRQVCYTVCETRYDHCGRAYQVDVTRYRTERVPVRRQVRVRIY